MKLYDKYNFLSEQLMPPPGDYDQWWIQWVADNWGGTLPDGSVIDVRYLIKGLTKWGEAIGVDGSSMYDTSNVSGSVNRNKKSSMTTTNEETQMNFKDYLRQGLNEADTSGPSRVYPDGSRPPIGVHYYGGPDGYYGGGTSRPVGGRNAPSWARRRRKKHSGRSNPFMVDSYNPDSLNEQSGGQQGYDSAIAYLTWLLSQGLITQEQYLAYMDAFASDPMGTWNEILGEYGQHYRKFSSPGSMDWEHRKKQVLGRTKRMPPNNMPSFMIGGRSLNQGLYK